MTIATMASKAKAFLIRLFQQLGLIVLVILSMIAELLGIVFWIAVLVA